MKAKLSTLNAALRLRERLGKELMHLATTINWVSHEIPKGATSMLSRST